jgi:hypothetical protein
VSRTAIRRDDFDTILVSELETLLEGERRLKDLYSQLRKRPHLRELFLGELAAVQCRAERLHAVLNPYDALHPAAAVFSGPSLSPAA